MSEEEEYKFPEGKISPDTFRKTFRKSKEKIKSRESAPLPKQRGFPIQRVPKQRSAAYIERQIRPSFERDLKKEALKKQFEKELGQFQEEGESIEELKRLLHKATRSQEEEEKKEALRQLQEEKFQEEGESIEKLKRLLNKTTRSREEEEKKEALIKLQEEKLQRQLQEREQRLKVEAGRLQRQERAGLWPAMFSRTRRGLSDMARPTLFPQQRQQKEIHNIPFDIATYNFQLGGRHTPSATTEYLTQNINEKIRKTPDGYLYSLESNYDKLTLDELHSKVFSVIRDKKIKDQFLKFLAMKKGKTLHDWRVLLIAVSNKKGIDQVVDSIVKQGEKVWRSIFTSSFVLTLFEWENKSPYRLIKHERPKKILKRIIFNAQIVALLKASKNLNFIFLRDLRNALNFLSPYYSDLLRFLLLNMKEEQTRSGPLLKIDPKTIDALCREKWISNIDVMVSGVQINVLMSEIQKKHAVAAPVLKRIATKTGLKNIESDKLRSIIKDEIYSKNIVSIGDILSSLVDQFLSDNTSSLYGEFMASQFVEAASYSYRLWPRSAPYALASVISNLLESANYIRNRHGSKFEDYERMCGTIRGVILLSSIAKSLSTVSVVLKVVSENCWCLASPSISSMISELLKAVVKRNMGKTKDRLLSFLLHFAPLDVSIMRNLFLNDNVFSKQQITDDLLVSAEDQTKKSEDEQILTECQRNNLEKIIATLRDMKESIE